jgi:hypothetical protein
MSRHCKIVVLPEDSCHADLARGYFQGRKVSEKAYDLRRKWTGKNGNNAAVLRWLCEEVRRQNHPGSPRYGIIALIDEDGRGLGACQTAVRTALTDLGLPAIDPNGGRCLILPMRNVETWMVWAARWQAAGSQSSPTGPVAYDLVSEEDDYKKLRNPNGNPIPNEPKMEASQAGKLIAKLNPACPPAGTPPALREIPQPLSDFLHWCQL